MVKDALLIETHSETTSLNMTSSFSKSFVLTVDTLTRKRVFKIPTMEMESVLEKFHFRSPFSPDHVDGNLVPRAFFFWERGCVDGSPIKVALKRDTCGQNLKETKSHPGEGLPYKNDGDSLRKF